MRHFKSADDFRHFAWLARRSPAPESDNDVLEFLHALLLTCSIRTIQIWPGTRVWRAQIGFDQRPIDERGFVTGIQPHPPARMRPSSEFAVAGRVSTKAAPCFYCSNNAETAMSEVRPWLGARVSIARFRTKSPLKLLNLTKLYDSDIKTASFGVHEEDVWRELGEAFSAPTGRENPDIDYRPTQIVASFFRRNGFNGLFYASLLGPPGKNMAFFDLDVVDLVSCAVREVRSLQYGFGERENEYRIKAGADDA